MVQKQESPFLYFRINRVRFCEQWGHALLYLFILYMDNHAPFEIYLFSIAALIFAIQSNINTRHFVTQ